MDSLWANLLTLCREKGARVRVSEVSSNAHTVEQCESFQRGCNGQFSKMKNRCQSNRFVVGVAACGN
jgi:hypothetical protein